MKNSIKLFFSVILFTSVLSCSNNTNEVEEPIVTDQLIGTWLRIDSDDSQKTKLEFYNNNEGLKINEATDSEGTISGAIPFSWTRVNNQLEIEFINQNVITPFQFTAEGNLILSNYSDIEFVKQ